ncbi:MAG: ROK family protein, partial [Bacteroidetes bacterium]|nr:ROK family protein [Bacteroidota bacterium]
SSDKPPTVKVIDRAARQGDKSATRIWNDAVLALGNLIGSYVTLINPECIVLGGGVLSAAPRLWKEAEPIARARATLTTGAAVEYHLSPLGDDAAALGAAFYAYMNRNS